MFDLPILDVAIGLVFVFLVLSLVVTAINELIASWLKRRSTTMWRGVVRMLGREDWATQLYSHPLISSLTEEPWLKKYRTKLPFKKRPSYIPSRTFALALLDTLAPAATAEHKPGTANLRAALTTRLASNKDDHLAKSLIVLLDDAAGDLEEFKKNVEVWFNTSMERVSGWYKRRTQWILLLLGLIVTVSMNVDTIEIANTLWTDPSIRSAVVARAQRFVDQERKESEAASAEELKPGPPEPPDRLPYEMQETEYETASEKVRQSVAELKSLALPIGWRDRLDNDRREEFPLDGPQIKNALHRHSLGWLLTAIAISLGSPFWFDLLNKIMSIRAAGKAPEEEPKAPKKVPAPVEAGGKPAGNVAGKSDEMGERPTGPADK